MDVVMSADEFLKGQNEKLRTNEYIKINNNLKGTVGMTADIEKEVREHDKAIDRLAFVLEQLSNNQKEISDDMKELVRQVNILAKVDESIKRIHERIDKEIVDKLDSYDTALKEFYTYKVTFEGMKDRVKAIEESRNKVVWGVLSAVGMALLGLVLK